MQPGVVRRRQAYKTPRSVVIASVLVMHLKALRNRAIKLLVNIPVEEHPSSDEVHPPAVLRVREPSPDDVIINESLSPDNPASAVLVLLYPEVFSPLRQ